VDGFEPREQPKAEEMAERKSNFAFYVDKSLHPLKQRDGIVEAAGSYNAAFDLIHTALRARSARVRGLLVCYAVRPSLSLFECNG